MSAAALAAPNDLATEKARSLGMWLIAIAVVVPTFMEVLDTTIANVALRYIAGGLSAASTDSEWVITSYLAANAIILPITGWLATHLEGGVISFSRSRFSRSPPCFAASATEPLAAHRLPHSARPRRRWPPACSQGILLDTFPAEKQGAAQTSSASPPCSPHRRPHAWRLHHRRIFLALDLLHQRPRRPPRPRHVCASSFAIPPISPNSTKPRSATLALRHHRREPPRPHPRLVGNLSQQRPGMGLVRRPLRPPATLRLFFRRGLAAFLWRETRCPNPIVSLRPLRDRNFASAASLSSAPSASSTAPALSSPRSSRPSSATMPTTPASSSRPRAFSPSSPSSSSDASSAKVSTPAGSSASACSSWPPALVDLAAQPQYRPLARSSGRASSSSSGLGFVFAPINVAATSTSRASTAALPSALRPPAQRRRQCRHHHG
jgi:hypothetical protein